ncbi:phosphatase PAP2 family protein [Rhodococcus sp. RS1C4]|uniref:phosphatase PAP2 family protein n=1 Tax=Nocardiaceae TaxID=85025 RepID=UPI0003804794|nr:MULTISPECIES: phosphatase PAP2 family protein [Rhodococcus]OZC55221.1 phosphatase PAP2 family protein [Rhodococcus sp. 06-621-2]OZC57741.1 phosphatase PAP2 family protein [Rhodococcus sp. RS1C4]OZD11865.1 phosphatase PAP2 family protein [Rhodococcus sp. 06-156-4C]OZD23529.1 phosphatase PAP2 family protein [Rhodococcus sp. 06-156-4a]OZD27045.1 phosphatase PAP2 family protein [Rhodococcus sp. 06-156-3C]
MDADVLLWMVEHRVAWVTSLFWVITTLGNTVWMFVWSIAGCSALLMSGRRPDAIMVGGAMLTGWGAMSLAKLLWGRARPPVPERLVEISSYSFPSGHAMMSAILATVTIAVLVTSRTPWLHRRSLLALPVVGTLAIGFSRIYLGAHWTTDVLAGWVFGALWGLLWIVVVRAISDPRSRTAAR